MTTTRNRIENERRAATFAQEQATNKAARKVRKALNDAGIAKAGRYTAGGYVDKDGNPADGYIVHKGRDYVAVLFTGYPRVEFGTPEHRDAIARASAALTAAGIAHELESSRYLPTLRIATEVTR